MTATPKCVSHHYACDCREAMFTDLQDEVGRLRDALRKAVIWAECASMRLTYEQRKDLNWTYLNEAREALQTPPESADETKFRLCLECKKGIPFSVNRWFCDECEDVPNSPQEPQACEHKWEGATLFDTDNTETHGMDCVKCLKFVATQEKVPG